MKVGRRAYQVRVRIQASPFKWVKKSKFYNARGPKDAVAKYKGPGHVMWVQKVSREKILGGVGEFFSLGDKLLKEFASDSNNQENLKEKVRKRRGYYDRQRKAATDFT